ncbi:MAG: hypothetical protein Q7S92_06120 [Candidatus Diapherotrites archaeon]|nr:hypothetical protein [Candidatus Diapherotrites archaeon]
MNKIVISFLVILLIAGCTAPPSAGTSGADIASTDTEISAGKGNLVVTATDDEPTSNIDQINVTYDLLACAGETCTTLSENSKMNILDTAGLSAVMANVELLPGEYTELKLANVSVQSRTETGQVETQTLPSTEIVLANAFSVRENGTTLLQLDFPADNWYSSDPTTPIEPVIETMVVENAVIETQTVEVDGVSYEHVNIETGIIDSVYQNTITESGTNSREVPPTSSSSVNIHVKEDGTTTAVMIDARTGTISSVTQETPAVGTILQQAVEHTGLSLEQTKQAVDFTHEEIENLSKQAAEEAYTSLKTLVTEAQTNAVGEEATAGFVDSTVLIKESKDLDKAQQALEQIQTELAEFSSFGITADLESKVEARENFMGKVENHVVAIERTSGAVNLEAVTLADLSEAIRCLSCAGTERSVESPTVNQEMLAIVEQKLTEAVAQGNITPAMEQEARTELTRWQTGEPLPVDPLAIVNARIFQETLGIDAKALTYEDAIDHYGLQGRPELYQEAIVFHSVETGENLETVAPWVSEEFGSNETAGAPVVPGFFVPNYSHYKNLGGELSQEQFESKTGLTVSGIRVDGQSFLPPPQYYTPPAGFTVFKTPEGDLRLGATFKELGTANQYQDNEGVTWSLKEDGKWEGQKTDGSTIAMEPYKPAEGEGQYAFVPPATEGKSLIYVNPFNSNVYTVYNSGEYRFKDSEGETHTGTLWEGAPPALGAQGFVAPENWEAPEGYTPPSFEHTDSEGNNWFLNSASGVWTSGDGAVATATGAFIPSDSGTNGGTGSFIPEGYVPNDLAAASYTQGTDGGFSYTGGSYTSTSYAFDSQTGSFTYTGTGTVDSGGTYNADTGTYSGGSSTYSGTGNYTEGSSPPPGGNGGGGMGPAPGGDSGGGAPPAGPPPGGMFGLGWDYTIQPKVTVYYIQSYRLQ